MQKPCPLPPTDKKIFFIGISGIGMSSLAIFFKQMGYQVSGSTNYHHKNLDHLNKNNIKFHVGHKKENIAGYDYIVFSTAIKNDNEELLAAKALNLPTLHRSEALAMLMYDKDAICVAGCHGKTTITSMIASSLASLQVKLNVCIGGISTALDTNAIFDRNSKIFIAEADESDKSFLNLFYDILIISNIELDHLETFSTYEEILNAYLLFARNHKGAQNIIACVEDNGVVDFLEQLQKNETSKITTYGFSKNADYYATNTSFDSKGTSFTLHRQSDNEAVQILLQCYGNHNILNAMAAIIALCELGIDLRTAAHGISQFQGTHRRFFILHNSDFVVVDDYAHHPKEFESVLQSARQFMTTNGLQRLVCVLEPHRYSRLQATFDECVRAFNEGLEGLNSMVYITPLYSAGEKPIEGINSQVLSNAMKHKSETILNETVSEVFHKNKQVGDLWLFMGAGYISSIAKEIKYQ